MYGQCGVNFWKKYYPNMPRNIHAQFQRGEIIIACLAATAKMMRPQHARRFGSGNTFSIDGTGNDPGINYGWMRRIASGVLQQFCSIPVFKKTEVPTLGFMACLEPAVRLYSAEAAHSGWARHFWDWWYRQTIPSGSTPKMKSLGKELEKGEINNRYRDSSRISSSPIIQMARKYVPGAG